MKRWHFYMAKYTFTPKKINQNDQIKNIFK